MKKVLFLLICLLPSMATWAGTRFNYSYEGQTLTYEIINETEQTCMVVGHANPITGAVTFPSASKYDGVLYLVVGIGDNAFEDCSSLTSVTIPNSVTSIGKSVFYYCKNLKSVTIPNSVTSIGDSAFVCCSALTSVAIPNSVTSIGDGAFSSCSALTSVVIPNSVTSIGDGAFGVCSALTSVTIPNSVTSIGRGAFGYCFMLKEIYYGAENPVVGRQDIFYDYKNPTLYVKASAMDKIKATIPWSLFEKIEAYEFSGIDDITVDNKQIDYSAEYEVYNLNGQKIGDSLENLAPGVYIIGQGRKVEKRMIK